MIINKYLAGILTLAIVALTGFQVILPDGVTATEAWQFGGLVVAAIGTLFVPLLSGAYAAALKVGVAVAGAVFAAGVPFFTDGWSFAAIIVVGIAALNALAVQIGVAVRIDQATAVLSNPNVSKATIEFLDAPAVRAVVAVPSAITYPGAHNIQ
jgi:O-antigen ligase